MCLFRSWICGGFGGSWYGWLLLGNERNTVSRIESTVSEKRTHWASLSSTANSVSAAKKTRWVRFGTQIIGRELRSCRPFTGVLFGESPKVLRRVLSECFVGIPGKCPGECPENWECPRECSQECLSSFFPKERHSWEHSLEHSQFSGHSRGHSPGHFPGIPTKHSESTRRSTFGDSPKSTPVNGRQDLKPRGTHWVRSPELSEPQKNSLSSVFETVLSKTVFGPFPIIYLNSCQSRFSSVHLVL